MTESGAHVSLGPDFFQGGLVGGVGRTPQTGYLYRGMIVIDGSGHVTLMTPGQAVGVPVRRMQARAALRTQLLAQ